MLRSVGRGKITAATSILTVSELAKALRKDGLSDNMKKVVEMVFSLDISFLQVDFMDVRDRVVIIDRYRISPFDCVHTVVMVRVGIAEIVSTDREFDNGGRETSGPTRKAPWPPKLFYDSERV